MSSTSLRVKELLKLRGWTMKVLAEKTGISESYLTHIKNGTRRWNEDSLKKLAQAFQISPIDLFVSRKKHVAAYDTDIESAPQRLADLKVKTVPVVGTIPSNPSAYNNQLMQVTTGFRDSFVPILGCDDDAVFCLHVDNTALAPRFEKGALLIISPERWTRSGDIAAVEYGKDEQLKRIIAQVTYMDEFIVLESVNHKNPPIALIRGKDHFRVLGRVVYCYQKVS